MRLKDRSELQHGKYRIMGVLGQGGFGITYLAENILLKKKVAIKEFFPKDFCARVNTNQLTLGTQHNAETVSKLKDRFLKEARNIARLDHPGIVKIHDVFEENNTAYYVMDYIDGDNLNEIVKRNGPLLEAKAVEYICKVGNALNYIHSRNMTHFDVKPANIVVRKSDDYPILLDFGLSKQYDNQGGATSTLLQGVSNGYSPIELYNPDLISSFSPQTDVYSLAATLYFLLSGTQPSTSATIIQEGLSKPINIKEETFELIKKGMSPSQRNRFLSVKEFTNPLSNLKENIINSEVKDDINKNEEVVDEDEHTKLLSSSKSNTPYSLTTLLEENKSLKEVLSDKEFQLNSINVLLKQKLEEVEELNETVEKKNSAKNTAWIISTIVIVIIIIISTVTNNQKSNDIETLNYWLSQGQKQNEELTQKVNSLNSEIEQRNNIIKTISKNNQVFITDAEVMNEGQDYGAKIYSRNSTFITPRIKVINLSNESKTIGVKFFAPYGLETGSISKNGFSYTDFVPANYGNSSDQWMVLTGWGNNEKGSWMPGKYRIEFWVDGKQLYTKHFTVY